MPRGLASVAWSGIAAWWRAGGPAPQLDRSVLDWQNAHAAVTGLLAEVIPS